MVRLRGLEREIERFKGDAGFEQIAKALGVDRPRKTQLAEIIAEVEE